MSLLALTNQPNANGYYFALDTTPTDPTVTAPAFTATGAAGGNGTFTALGDAVPGGIGMFNMAKANGDVQWAIGMDAVPAGGNSGNNFALFAYDDNGAFLSAPISVQRATGGVITQNGLTTTTLAATGAVTADSVVIDGVTAQKSQTDFTVQRTVALPSVLPAGVNNYNIGAVFQLPTSGLYLVDGALGFNASAGADTFVCAPGDYISFFLQAQPAAPGILNGGVEVDVVPVPASASQTDRAFSNCVVDKLTGSYNYQAIAVVYNFSGTMAATGGATLIAGVDIAALCS